LIKTKYYRSNKKQPITIRGANYTPITEKTLYRLISKYNWPSQAISFLPKGRLTRIEIKNLQTTTLPKKAYLQLIKQVDLNAQNSRSDRDNIDSINEHIAEYQNALIRLIRKRSQLLIAQNKKYNQKTDKEYKQKVTTDLSSLKNNPYIQKIKIINDISDYSITEKKLLETVRQYGCRLPENVILVYTKNICIQYENSIYSLGRYLIFINPNSGSRNTESIVRIINQDPAHHNDNLHPHVFDDGRCCFGNIEEMIPELIANNKLAKLIHLIIAFLTSYNKNDPYNRIEYRFKTILNVPMDIYQGVKK